MRNSKLAVRERSLSLMCTCDPPQVCREGVGWRGCHNGGRGADTVTSIEERLRGEKTCSLHSRRCVFFSASQRTYDSLDVCVAQVAAIYAVFLGLSSASLCTCRRFFESFVR